jgi:hypothetical protein
VARVAGVRALNNEIQVEDATPFDWSLRQQLYNRIYHSLTFEQWARQWDKPIRVVIEPGGKKTELDLYFTELYVKEGDQWRMALWQSTRLPALAPATK